MKSTKIQVIDLTSWIMTVCWRKLSVFFQTIINHWSFSSLRREKWIRTHTRPKTKGRRYGKINKEKRDRKLNMKTCSCSIHVHISLSFDKAMFRWRGGLRTDGSINHLTKYILPLCNSSSANVPKLYVSRLSARLVDRPVLICKGAGLGAICSFVYGRYSEYWRKIVCIWVDELSEGSVYFYSGQSRQGWIETFMGDVFTLSILRGLYVC